jgi:hypothetical protein
MKISRFGFMEDKTTVERARDEFARAESAVLTGFLEADLAQRFTGELDAEACAPNVHHAADNREFARDLTFSSTSGVLHALHLMLNNPRLFAAIRQITGCGPIGCFAGRIYRNLPSPEYRLDWHDDTQTPHRLIGLSMSLTVGSLEGGLFRLRRKSTREILAEVAHSRPGNAHIFRIDSAIEHCVTAVQGELPRTAFAGWFQSSPDLDTFIRSLYVGPKAHSSVPPGYDVLEGSGQ